jgi:hypothetical protein
MKRARWRYRLGIAAATAVIAARSDRAGSPVQLVAPVLAQQAPGAVQRPPTPRSQFEGPAPAPSRVERIGPEAVRIGSITIDTAKKEFAVAGFVNDVTVLEFLANTRDGYKAYESALELDTNAVDFNVACLLIGLDSTGAALSRFQFDPQPPQGKPVELFVEWEDGGAKRRIRAEQLIYNRTTKETLTEGPWVYTGSAFVERNIYLAQMDGTLVGFMHTPSPIIENPRPMNGKYGESIINPQLNLKPKAAVRMIVRAVAPAVRSK